eukprot:gene3259-3473_t
MILKLHFLGVLTLFLLIQIGLSFVPIGSQTLAWRLQETSTKTVETEVETVISMSPNAIEHLKTIKNGNELYLRMGVKSGGCSGLSYVMDVIKAEDIQEDDHVELVEGINCVIDPKSLLYIFGLKLDYSDQLIGGGFKFSNPNAETSCGCGKSFGV